MTAETEVALSSLCLARQYIEQLEAELVALRRQCAGHCERIAAASEVIGKCAERNPLPFLESWQQARPGRNYCIYVAALDPDAVRVELLQCYGPIGRQVLAYSCHGADTERVCYAGTAERQATLAETVAAALTRWRGLYGEEASKP